MNKLTCFVSERTGDNVGVGTGGWEGEIGVN